MTSGETGGASRRGPRAGGGRAQSASVEFDVPATMRDGVTLRADVYRPVGPGPWPTLLTRTPYGKDDPRGSATLDAMQAARGGFLVVVQDVRGRFASDGEWLPLRCERQDGHDSVEWAARLPGSNGRVGMYGGSYCGSTQWSAAVERPPSLGAIAPTVTWCEPLDGLLARGGALELGLELPWTLHTGVAHVGRLPLGDDERAARAGSLLSDFDALPTDGYWGLPTHDMAVLRRHGMPGLGTVRAEAEPPVADWSRVAGRHEQVEIPTFNIGGWHDAFLQGTLDNYTAMAALGRPARLVVGPWAHTNSTTLSDPTGQLSFGIRANGVGAPQYPQGDLNEHLLWWFRGQLGADRTESASTDAPVRIFVMGRNGWRDESSWPLERARSEHWYLAAGGVLQPNAPPVEPQEPTRFVYDPADPVPTVGGQTADMPAFPPGPYEQSAVEARPDVLVFTSEPLREDVEVTGRVRLWLCAASSAPSTDWVARLCDVHPDGRSFNVCDGILRVPDRADSLERRCIDLWSTSNVFLRGHRLRVHVTSSSFPRWDRNLNTGDQRLSHFEVARQTICHDSERASFIELPVVVC